MHDLPRDRLAAMRLAAVLVLAAGLLTAASFAYPPLLEGSDGECSAFERRIGDLISHDGTGRLTVNPLYGSSSSSPSGAAFAKDRYPLLPAEIGCTIAYWKTALGATLPVTGGPLPAVVPPPSTPPGEARAAAEGGHRNGEIISTIARDITPNGDPISPGPLFTLPMHTIAIRVEYPGGKADAARFQLLQGRAVIASCVAQKSGLQTAWCRFDVELRKGNYSIAFTANNALIGQFPFTVLGR